MAAAIRGQEASLRSPAQWEPPAALQKLDTADADLGVSKSVSLLSGALKWGPVDLHPHLTYRVTYGDGLQSAPGVNRTTVAQTLSPGVTFQIGPLWSLDYTPSLTYYSNKAFRDTLAHSVALRGGAAYNEWRFGIFQGYSVSSDPLIETAEQTGQETFTTSLSASRPVGSKLLLQLSLNQNFRSAQLLNSSRSWSTMEWLNYQIAPRVSIGGGVGGGFDDVSVGSDMFNEQLQGRVDMRIAEKLNLGINGGFEFRQFTSVDADTLITPIYGASIQYRPFQHTTLTLAGNRVVSPSLFSNLITEGTTISAAVNQRLLGLLYLTVTGSYGTTDYLVTAASLPNNRSDERKSVVASLSYQFWKKVSSSISYQFSQNTSSAGGFSYNSNLIGLTLGYHY